MVPYDVNQLHQQMSEVARSLRVLAETLEVRHAEVDKLHDLLRKEVVTLGRDQRDLAEKLDCVICVMQSDIEAIRKDAALGAKSIQNLLMSVTELRQPVGEIIALRSRAAGLLLGIGIIGSAVIWLAEPVYRWFVTQNSLKQ